MLRKILVTLTFLFFITLTGCTSVDKVSAQDSGLRTPGLLKSDVPTPAGSSQEEFSTTKTQGAKEPKAPTKGKVSKPRTSGSKATRSPALGKKISPLSQRRAAVQDYTIGPKDLIEISVWGNDKLFAEMPVRPDGMISFPLVGDIKAGGLTPGQLRKKIEVSLKEYVTNPNVSVILKAISNNAIRVSVGGEVNVPGFYEVPNLTTLLHAISIAKGYTETADLKKSYLLRQGEKIDVDFLALIEHSDWSQNVLLQNNDLVYFPKNFIKFSVGGEVNAPGSFQAQNPTTLLHAISIAKGFKETADLNTSYLLRRGKKVKVNFAALTERSDLSQNVLLQNNDLIYFPSNFENRINIIGEVVSPQVIRFQEGMTLLDAVLLAGGPTQTAKPGSTKIYRMINQGSGKKTTRNIEVELDKVIFDGDLSQNLPLQPGDIILIPRSFF